LLISEWSRGAKGLNWRDKVWGGAQVDLCYNDSMKQIEQTYRLKAPIVEVWQALTDASMAEKWGAGPAKVDATEGGEFSYWDGDIHGTNTRVVPEKLLEQDWYGHDHPERKFKAIFTFETDGEITIVHLVFAGDIENEQKDIADWQEYYFNPIKALLEHHV
jgi:uncharacterized protein YndB with AHSA1/START domain